MKSIIRAVRAALGQDRTPAIADAGDKITDVVQYRDEVTMASTPSTPFSP